MSLSAAERSRRYRERRRAIRQAPSVVARAADPTVPDTALDPLELAVRQARLRIIGQQFGGLDRLTVVNEWKVNLAAKKWLQEEYQYRDLHRQTREGRATHKDRDAWLRTVESLERSLRDLGTGQTGPREQTLDDIVAEYARGEAPTQRAAREAVQVEPRPETTGMPAPEGVIVEPGSSGAGQAGRNEQPEDVRERGAEVVHRGDPQDEVTVRPASLSPRRLSQAEVEAAGYRVVMPSQSVDEQPMDGPDLEF